MYLLTSRDACMLKNTTINYNGGMHDRNFYCRCRRLWAGEQKNACLVAPLSTGQQ